MEIDERREQFENALGSDPRKLDARLKCDRRKSLSTEDGMKIDESEEHH
jgi:hypothetical protein